jgi:hypothetical protein
MKDTIFTIPISEVFDPKVGCSLCNMRDILEKRYVEYIMGGAMMEVDVRKKTNQMGFCLRHAQMMQNLNNRLSLALILKSRLSFVKENEIKTLNKNSASQCYICDKIDSTMQNMINNIFSVYSNSNEFRKLFADQEFFCLQHFKMLTNQSKKMLKKNIRTEFLTDIVRVNNNYIDNIYCDITEFCDSFDYRNSSKQLSHDKCKISPEAAIKFLSSYK